MTQATPAPTATSATAAAMSVVDLGAARVRGVRPPRPRRPARPHAGSALADPVVHIVVAGEFKQGKSSLVNALVGANVCPVDDDVATAVPTYVRYGEEHAGRAALRRRPAPHASRSPFEDVRQHVVEGGVPPARRDRVAGVEIRLPRKMLAGGLVMVDTPGVGGLGSAHAAASLAAISMADAVLFVTDAAQELTRSELDFLQQARRLCSTVVCVLDQDRLLPGLAAHPRPRRGSPAAGRRHADHRRSRRRCGRGGQARTTRAEHRVGLRRPGHVRAPSGSAAARRDRLAAEAAAEVIAVCDQLNGPVRGGARRAGRPGVGPAGGRRAQRHQGPGRGAASTAAAKWNQTLNDGVTDLNSDIDHDLRDRIREVHAGGRRRGRRDRPGRHLGRRWSPGCSRADLVRAARQLHAAARACRRAERARSADHFREASGTDPRASSRSTTPRRWSPTSPVEHKIELDKMKAGKQAMVALKSAYGGVLMFTMLGALTGIALGPIGLGIGLVMGHKGLRDEKKRQLSQRRAQAKNAMRRYCDEVSFVMGKDSRDTLRRVQRAAARPLQRAGRGAEPVQRRGARRPRTTRSSGPRPSARSGCATSTPSWPGCASSRERAERGSPRRSDGMSLIDRTRGVLTRAVDVYRGTGHDARLVALRDRLDEPLRVAIAGRVKSGKSTLLNALVGERLAPTDAGECTRIVTWYRDGHTYQVMAAPAQRRAAPAAVHPRRRRDRGRPRRPGARGRATSSIVTWPSQALRTATLIDTPGIGSLSEQVSRRAWELLAADDEETPADAVLYLMRHLHASDLEFLRAFHDTEVSRPNPVNAIGVLSRADEIGVGRLDSMASARRIATRLGDRAERPPGGADRRAGGRAARRDRRDADRDRGARTCAGSPTLPVARGRGAAADRRPVRRTRCRSWASPRIEREALLARFGLFGVRLARQPAARTARRRPRPTWPASWPSAAASASCRRCSARCSSSGATCSRAARRCSRSTRWSGPTRGRAATRSPPRSRRSSPPRTRSTSCACSRRCGPAGSTGKPDVVADLERLIGGAGAAPHLRLRPAGRRGRRPS